MIAEKSGAPCPHLVSARQTALGFSHAPTNTHDFRRNLLTSRRPTTDYIGADQPDMQLPIPADVCVTSVVFLHTHAGCRLFCVPLLLLAFRVT